MANLDFLYDFGLLELGQRKHWISGRLGVGFLRQLKEMVAFDFFPSRIPLLLRLGRPTRVLLNRRRASSRGLIP